MTVAMRRVVQYQITYFILAPEAMQDQPMNRHLNRCEKVDGQSGMTIQRRFNDENRS